MYKCVDPYSEFFFKKNNNEKPLQEGQNKNVNKEFSLKI